jgi:hypothetical protein
LNLGLNVIGVHFFEVELAGQGGEVGAPLNAARQDGDGITFGASQIMGREGGGRTGSMGGDPGAIHHRVRDAGFGIVEDEQAGNIRQAASLVGRVTADPLDAGRAHGRDVGRHGMDEGIGKGMDTGFWRHFDLSKPFFHERLLKQADDGGHVEVDLLNIGTREVEQFGG